MVGEAQPLSNEGAEAVGGKVCSKMERIPE